MITDDAPKCPHCGADVEWVACGNCDEGFSHHDCGEDTCCCLYPEDNVRCDICFGHGGWALCIERCQENEKPAAEKF